MNELVCRTTHVLTKTSLKHGFINHVLLRGYRGGRLKRRLAVLNNRESAYHEPTLEAGAAYGHHQEPFEFPKTSVKNREVKINDELDKYLDFPSDTLRYWEKKKNEERQKRRNQSSYSFRPQVDPRNTSVFLFSGQGSQFVGMGEKLIRFPKVMEMYNTASKILGYDLLEVCLKGPKEMLDKTIYCQPAIVVTSLAAVEKLKHSKPLVVENCVTAAGYSVGEISALVFAGALTFEDAILLVKTRAEAMQRASNEVQGRMMTVFVSPETQIKFACHAAKLFCERELKMEDAVCWVSNYIHPTCKVISGNSEALEFVARNAKEFGIKRASFLPVSGAFHSHLMKPALTAVNKVLTGIQVQDPVLPVHSNVTSKAFNSPEDIRKLLSQHIYKPVMWEQTMHKIYSRPQDQFFPRTFELGPGKQLGQILKMVNSKAYADYENVDV